MYKSKLQQLCHQHSWTLPKYVTVKDGPDHNPKFRATVSVNGVEFPTPSDQCRSSKEAQNQVAKLAFDHFTLPLTPNGSLVSNSSIQPAKTAIVQTSVHSSLQNINNVMSASLASKEIPSKIYKNQLQMYAQKKSLGLPTYSSEIEGPPHARRFKSMVTVEGKSYSSPDFYPTLKVAEQAAAKVALESLPCSEIAEDDSLYKGLLQDLTIVEGLGTPIYETTKSGPPHLPTFVSIVGIKGENFQGQESKLKKQAEMSAAKVAYKCLMDRRASRNLEHKSEATNESRVSVKRENQENETKTNITIQKRLCEEDKDCSRRSPEIIFPKMEHYESKSTEVNYLARQKQANEDRSRRSPEIVFPKMEYCESESTEVNYFARQKQANEDRSRQSPAIVFPNMEHCESESTEVNFLTRQKQANEDTKRKSESDLENELYSDTKKVIVCPRNQNSTYPTGSSVLPFSDEKWIAMVTENPRLTRMFE